MGEWKPTKWGDIATLEYGKGLENYRRDDGAFPVYGTNGKIGTADKFLCATEGIIIGRKGAYRGVHYSPVPFFVIDTAFYLKPTIDELDWKYAFYQLKTVDIDLMDSGSAIPSTSREDFYDIDIFLPPLPEQKAIAEVLSSLDNKIDLLHRQNNTLEFLAQTLFRQWFIEQAEDSWEIGVLPDEFDFTMGQSPRGETFNEEGNGTIFYQGRTDFGFRFPEPRVFTVSPTRFAKKFDTLVSVRAPVGDMNMAIEDCSLGRGVASFRYKRSPKYQSYTYYKMRSLMESIKQFEDNGTVFGSIGKEDFKKLENPIPSEHLVEEFQNIAHPLDEKIFENTRQIANLEKIRDSLLPKLMSGTLTIRK